MTSEHTRSVPRVVATGAAITLAIISAACAALYGWSIGLHHSLALAGLLAAAAFAAEGLKPLAVVATIEALQMWRLLSAVLFALLALVLVAYSVTAELSLSATTRGDVAAGRESAAKAYARAERTYRRAEAELAALAPARSPEVLRPLIRQKLATRGARCDADPRSLAYGKVSRTVCPVVRAMEAEAARHAQRQVLAATV